MKIIFRCDASEIIGLGHLARCLSVAKFCAKKHQIIFATNNNLGINDLLPSNYKIIFADPIEEESSFFRRLVELVKPDVFFIDKKYNYKEDSLLILKDNNIKIIMLDNLCKGLNLVDEIIIPGSFIDDEIFTNLIDYKKIEKVKKGSDYIILNAALPPKSKLQKKKFKKNNRIVVTTGGSDPRNISLFLLSVLDSVNIDNRIEILIGKFSKNKQKINKFCAINNSLSIVPFNSKKLINGDIAICTFGVTFYELLYLGVPTICISHSKENALAATKLHQNFPYFVNLGYIDNILEDRLEYELNRFINEENYFNLFASNCFDMIDGLGAKRIASLISN